MKRIVLDIVIASASAVLVAIPLFASAGRVDLPFFWLYVAVMAAMTAASLAIMDPTLVRERLRPGPGGRDRLFTLAFVPFGLCQFVVAGLDVGRCHWSDGVPAAVQVAGLGAVVAALAVAAWSIAVNPFFSSVIRIQTDRGHHLVTAGPYRWVRHPAYAAAPFLFVGTGLALGSWLAALVGVLLIAGVLRRTAAEDRILREELAGYAAYAEKVRARLLPGVW